MPDNDIAALDALTVKQREVLDLLIQHKTSKEIARELGISPHTVDQRVQSAKERLGAESRSEAAVEYRRLVQIRDNVATGMLDSSQRGALEHSPDAESAFSSELAGEWDRGNTVPLTPLERGELDKMVNDGSSYRVPPAIFETRHGTLMRLGAIVLMTLLLLFIVLAGLAMFEALSRGFAR
jgi:DNA-binding CsgD family transcriptional regulator